MSARLDTLRNLITQDPNNSFLRYGLAMELMNTGDAEGAVAEFRTLIENDPKYTAGYFHGGRALEKLGRVDEARTIYQAGIEAAARIGDEHTRSELEGALSMLG